MAPSLIESLYPMSSNIEMKENFKMILALIQIKPYELATVIKMSFCTSGLVQIVWSGWKLTALYADWAARYLTTLLTSKYLINEHSQIFNTASLGLLPKDQKWLKKNVPIAGNKSHPCIGKR